MIYNHSCFCFLERVVYNYIHFTLYTSQSAAILLWVVSGIKLEVPPLCGGVYSGVVSGLDFTEIQASVQFDRCRCLRGRNYHHLHGQPWLHTITPQQTVPYAIPTILPVLFNACFILIIVYICLRNINTVARFYLFVHTVLRYFYY